MCVVHANHPTGWGSEVGFRGIVRIITFLPFQPRGPMLQFCTGGDRRVLSLLGRRACRCCWQRRPREALRQELGPDNRMMPHGYTREEGAAPSLTLVSPCYPFCVRAVLSPTAGTDPHSAAAGPFRMWGRGVFLVLCMRSMKSNENLGRHPHR